jgi:hypothetical protein
MTDDMEARLMARVDALETHLTHAEHHLLRRLNTAQERLTERLTTVRDDIAVTAAIVQRLDASITALTTEIRATHTQQSRFDRRLRKLEGED